MLVKLKGQINVVFEDLEIEADSEEDAINKLYSLSPRSIMNDSYIDNTEFSDLDVEIEEATYVVKVKNIYYSISQVDLYSVYEERGGDPDAELTNEQLEELHNLIIEDLPNELEVEVTCSPDLVDDYAIDAVSEETGWLIDSAEIEIIEIK